MMDATLTAYLKKRDDVQRPLALKVSKQFERGLITIQEFAEELMNLLVEYDNEHSDELI